jgi:hypothetical protein
MLHLRRRLVGLTAAVAIIAGILMAPSAFASYHLTQRAAQRSALDYVDRHYDVSGTIRALCRPQYLSYARPGYRYHRWLCGWKSTNECSGRLVIAGSSVPGRYYARPSWADC